MSTATFLIGLGLVVAGIAMIYVPAAFIAGGTGISLLAARHEMTRSEA